MTATIGAANGELVTRVGKLELRVPQDRESRFSTVLFGQRDFIGTIPEA